jgi:hypothetical protein
LAPSARVDADLFVGEAAALEAKMAALLHATRCGVGDARVRFVPGSERGDVVPRQGRGERTGEGTKGHVNAVIVLIRDDIDMCR